MLVIAVAINFVSSLITLMQLEGVFDNLNQYMVVVFGEAALNPMYAVLSGIPSQISMSRLIRNNIETSMFSLQTGLLSFTNMYWSKTFGNIINKWVGVSNKNLEDLNKLFWIGTICNLIPLLFLWIVPSNKEIRTT
jgi:hypothetical protein